MDDRQVGVGAHHDRALPRIEAHDPRRVGAELHAQLLQREPPAEHAAGVDQRQQGLEAGQPHRDLGPVPVPHRLLLAGEGAGVGRDHRDLAAAEPLPEPLDVLRLLDLGAAGEEVPVLPLEHRVVQHQVLGAGLGEHGHAARLGRAHDVRALGGGHVHDVELAAGRLAPLHRALDRLRLDEVGPGHRVEPRAVARHQLRRVVPRDQLVEHPRRLGVHQEHGAVLPHLLQRAEQGAVVRLPPLRLVDHELLEGGEPAVHHPLDLRLVLVPSG